MPNLRERLRAKRTEVLAICARRGAHNVRLFGSVARGEHDEASDIDLLVDMEAGRTLLDLAALQQELEALLGCCVDVVTLKGLKARIRRRVVQEAIPL